MGKPVLHLGLSFPTAIEAGGQPDAQSPPYLPSIPGAKGQPARRPPVPATLGGFSPARPTVSSLSSAGTRRPGVHPCPGGRRSQAGGGWRRLDCLGQMPTLVRRKQWLPLTRLQRSRFIAGSCTGRRTPYAGPEGATQPSLTPSCPPAGPWDQLDPGQLQSSCAPDTTLHGSWRNNLVPASPTDIKAGLPGQNSRCHFKCHGMFVAIYGIKNVNELIIELGASIFHSQLHFSKESGVSAGSRCNSVGVLITFYCYKSFNKRGKHTLYCFLACANYLDDVRNVEIYFVTCNLEMRLLSFPILQGSSRPRALVWQGWN